MQKTALKPAQLPSETKTSPTPVLDPTLSSRQALGTGRAEELLHLLGAKVSDINLGSFSVGVFIMRAVLFGVYIIGSDCWKLPGVGSKEGRAL